MITHPLQTRPTSTKVPQVDRLGGQVGGQEASTTPLHQFSLELIEDWVREHPAASMSIALIMGVSLGCLVKRR